MSRKQRPGRPANAVCCFIVKSHSKADYVRFLAQAFRKDVRVKTCDDEVGGSVLEKAKDIVSKHADYYSEYVVWLDKEEYLPHRDKPLENGFESGKEKVGVYVVLPCFENWLLAHFRKSMPKDAKPDSCEKELRKHIPEYEIGGFHALGEFIDKKGIRQAAANHPEIGKMIRIYFGI